MNRKRKRWKVLSIRLSVCVCLLLAPSCSLFQARPKVPLKSLLSQWCLNSEGRGLIQVDFKKYQFRYESVLQKDQFFASMQIPLHGEEMFSLPLIKGKPLGGLLAKVSRGFEDQSRKKSFFEALKGLRDLFLLKQNALSPAQKCDLMPGESCRLSSGVLEYLESSRPTLKLNLPNGNELWWKGIFSEGSFSRWEVELTKKNSGPYQEPILGLMLTVNECRE